MLLDKEMDPYAWFLSQASNGRRKAAQAARRLGSAESWVVDNGHAFRLERYVTTPKTGARTVFVYGDRVTQSPMTTCSQIIAPLKTGSMLFQYKTSSSSTGKSAKVSPFAVMDDWNPDYYGNLAMSKLAPNRPEINVAVTLAELLREGLPSGLLSGSWASVLSEYHRRKWSRYKETTLSDFLSFSKKGLKGASGDYLNFMFAVAPLVQDIFKLGQALYGASDILSQWQNDAGKGVRRQMVMKDTSKKVTFEGSDLAHQGQVGSYASHYPVIFREGSMSGYTGFQSTASKVTQVKRETIWFSGSFSYYIDVPTDFWSNIQYFNDMWARLVGKPISLEAIWELTPWSWLIDWFFGLQSIFSAVDRFSDQNLVVNYGYLMREVKYSTIVESTVGASYPANGDVKRFIRTVYLSERKERVRMNPFGVGVKTPEGLSGLQVSLLGAVGLSRIL